MSVIWIIVSLIFIWLAGRALLVLIPKLTFHRYWDAQLQLPSNNAFRLVVMGDSLAQGVGASSVQKTLVGRAATYIATKTNRVVHVANYSQSGATARDILDTQLPRADLGGTDIVLLEIGVNDSRKRTIQEFEQDMKILLQALPLEKTVIADIPYPHLRPRYQEVMRQLLVPSMHVVYPSRVFKSFPKDIFLTAGDFFHPNNEGYAKWFDVFRPGIDEVLSRLQSNSR